MCRDIFTYHDNQLSVSEIICLIKLATVDRQTETENLLFHILEAMKCDRDKKLDTTLQL